MRRIKNWNVFIRESISNLGLSKTELVDFFIELQDDGITSLLDINLPTKNAFLFFPVVWDKGTLRRLYYAMISKLEFPDVVDYGLEDFFLDPLNTDVKILYQSQIFVSGPLDEHKIVAGDHIQHFKFTPTTYTLDSNLSSDLTDKTFIELFNECVELGYIKAFYTTFIKLAPFWEKDFGLVIEKLELVYEATDYRPLSGSFWLEDYVNDTDDDVYTGVYSDICLVKCNDQEYKILNSVRDKILLGGGPNDINKQMTAHFI